ncbi:CapA family protein [Thiotrichales bacterium 19S3-7]|nr:CapA family protein [Thiotrichales bacterium 19S3-7]MCF6801431.1 CapA family protein [Thiotrichales bacterium 19S3-11]
MGKKSSVRIVVLVVIILLLFTALYIQIRNQKYLANPATLLELENSQLFTTKYLPLQRIVYSSYGLINQKLDQTNGDYTQLDQVEGSLVTSNEKMNSTDVQVVINIVGDVIPHSDLQVEAALNGATYYPMMMNIQKVLKSGDLNIANLETPVAPSYPYSGSNFRFNASPLLLTALKGVGFDLMLTANNHAIDQGDEGYRETIESVKNANLIPLGSWQNTNSEGLSEKSGNIQVIKGIKVGLINYTLLSNIQPNNPNLVNYISDSNRATKTITKHIQRLKKNGAEIVILLIHWGVEYHIFPEKNIYQLANELIHSGADIIIGGHPHVIQPVQFIQSGSKNKMVVYSLGNFISHQRGLSRYGMLMQLVLRKNQQDEVYLAKAIPKILEMRLSADDVSINNKTYTYFGFMLDEVPLNSFLNYQKQQLSIKTN